MEVRYVGHGTCLIDVDGVRLITDPVLRRMVLHLRRVAPLRLGPPRAAHAVLISHAHHDHLDVPSLLRLGRAAHLVVPRGAGRMLRRRGFSMVTEVEAGERVEVGPVGVRAVPAAHDGSRPPYVPAAPALGYVVEGSLQVYFAGDTGLYPDLAAIAVGVDVALLPVWGWGLRLGRGLHLDPESAAEAVRLLKPRVAIPIHWGTFLPAHRRRPSTLRTPPLDFAAAVRRLAPAVDVRVLQPGEQTVVTPRAP